MKPAMKPMMNIWLRVRRSAKDLFGDISGIAATEFAIVVPVMLLLFFGTDEFASGIAVNRKVTLMARTLSDLTSQSTSVADTDMTNFFAASTAIMTPYSATGLKQVLSLVFVKADGTVKSLEARYWRPVAGIAPPSTPP